MLVGPLFWHGVSCGLKVCWGFALADFVGVWLGLCSCMVLCLFPYVLALGLVECWLDVYVGSMFGVWLGQSCGYTKVGVFSLRTLLGLGWGVSICVCVCVCVCLCFALCSSMM